MRNRPRLALLALLLSALAGCWASTPPADPSVIISKCEAESRAAFYTQGASVGGAMLIYDNCIQREKSRAR